MMQRNEEAESLCFDASPSDSAHYKSSQFNKGFVGESAFILTVYSKSTLFNVNISHWHFRFLVQMHKIQTSVWLLRQKLKIQLFWDSLPLKTKPLRSTENWGTIYPPTQRNKLFAVFCSLFRQMPWQLPKS
jgi:hypothetical protein